MENGNKPITPIYWTDGSMVNESKSGDWENFSAQLKPLSGLTKREYFAGMAMQGILARHTFGDDDQAAQFEGAAKLSVMMADALLAELEKQNK